MQRHRIYFLLPDIDHCTFLVRKLKDSGLADKYIHVLASEDTPLQGLPEANIFDKTEIKHGVEMGLGVGGIAGLAAGLLAVTFPPAGLVLAGEAILLGTTLAGAGIGSIITGLISSDIPHHDIEHYKAAIAQGKVLLMLDVPASTVSMTVEMIEHLDPEVEISFLTQ